MIDRDELERLLLEWEVEARRLRSDARGTDSGPGTARLAGMATAFKTCARDMRVLLAETEGEG